ncbi:MAG: hypothetical protein ACKPCM_08910 [Pseudanabaena sp.]
MVNSPARHSKYFSIDVLISDFLPCFPLKIFLLQLTLLQQLLLVTLVSLLLIGDIQGKTEVDFDLLNQYIDRCFTSTNQFFQNLAIIQPGIPLIYEEGKAALNAAYIEHINMLVIGLCSDSRLKANVFCNAREAISLDLRISNILESVTSN